MDPKTAGAGKALHSSPFPPILCVFDPLEKHVLFFCLRPLSKRCFPPLLNLFLAVFGAAREENEVTDMQEGRRCRGEREVAEGRGAGRHHYFAKFGAKRANDRDIGHTALHGLRHWARASPSICPRD